MVVGFPPGQSLAIVARLNTAMNHRLQAPEVVSRMLATGTPAEFRKFITAVIAR